VRLEVKDRVSRVSDWHAGCPVFDSLFGGRFSGTRFSPFFFFLPLAGKILNLFFTYPSQLIIHKHRLTRRYAVYVVEKMSSNKVRTKRVVDGKYQL
jgi:hypothetical protein